MNDDKAGVQLKFIDPPPRRPGRTPKYLALSRELKKHPNRWALIAENIRPKIAANLTSSFNKGVLYGEGFEACSRTVDPIAGTVNVYVRYTREEKG